MVSIKETTENAVTFTRAALGPERTPGVRLEEVESTTVAGKDAWIVTLSMISPDDELPGNIAAALGKRKRDYKTFTVLKSRSFPEIHAA